MKRILLILTTLLLLTSCASKQMVSSSVSTMELKSNSGIDAYFGDYEAAYATDNLVKDGNYEERIEGEVEKKIIVTANANIETKDIANLLNKISTLVTDFNGYVQSSSSGVNYGNRRWNEQTIRIPAEKFDDFLAKMRDGENVTSFNMFTDEVTTQYYDLEAEIESLKLQRDVVEGFYKKAETLDDLIKVEQRLSELNYQIKAGESRLENYDLLTNYSTLTVYVIEVENLSAVEEDSFADRLQKQCVRSWEDFKLFAERALFFLIENVWYLLFFALVAYFILKKVVKRKSKQKEEKKKEILKDSFKYDVKKIGENENKKTNK